jgi:3-oxosteroid 1-dehydrogenase
MGLIRNLPDIWDMEADLVSVGSGIGGLAAAIAASDNGSTAIVLEKTDKVGGITALSVGECWIPGNHLAAAIGIEDSPESGFRYLKQLSLDYGDDVMILNYAVHARAALKWFEEHIGLKMLVIRGCPDYYFRHNNDAMAEGRMLEVEPFDAATLGEWQERTRVSHLVPYGMMHPEMYGKGGSANMLKWDYAPMAERLMQDQRCLGSGLAAYFVKGALDRGVGLQTGFEVRELIGDGTRVIGVRGVQDGRDMFVKANKGVVIAASSFEANHHLNKTLGAQIDMESMLFPGIDGANFRLAGPVGASVAKVPDITSLGLHIPGEEQETGEPIWRVAMGPMGQPHTITVNRAGKRFANEAFYRDIFYAVDQIKGANQTRPNFPAWLICDSQQREKYPFATIMPGQDWPEGFGQVAGSLDELAAKCGIDAAGLTETVARFNPHAERGEDPDFGRGSHPWSSWFCGDPFHKPNPNLGPLTKPPFYAVELKRIGGSAIPSAGLLIDRHARCLGWDGQPIPGLYAAGNSAARMETGAMMQSGTSNGRGMTHGWLAGLHAAGAPSTLLDAAVERMQGEAA